MAFTVTARHSGNTGSVSTPTEASDSQTPTASSLLLTFFGAENNFHTQVIGRSISGGSLTYTAVDAAPADGLAGYAFDTDATFAAGAALYRADVGGSPSAFTITVDQWATANDGAYAVLSCDVTGHSSSTPVQTKSFGTAITLADHPTGTLTLTARTKAKVYNRAALNRASTLIGTTNGQGLPGAQLRAAHHRGPGARSRPAPPSRRSSRSRRPRPRTSRSWRGASTSTAPRPRHRSRSSSSTPTWPRP
jgi:hypothetical protein